MRVTIECSHRQTSLSRNSTTWFPRVSSRTRTPRRRSWRLSPRMSQSSRLSWSRQSEQHACKEQNLLTGVQTCSHVRVRGTETTNGVAKGGRSTSAVALLEAPVTICTLIQTRRRQPRTRESRGRRTAATGMRSPKIYPFVGHACSRKGTQSAKPKNISTEDVQQSTSSDCTELCKIMASVLGVVEHFREPTQSEQVLSYLEQRAAEPCAPSAEHEQPSHSMKNRRAFI